MKPDQPGTVEAALEYGRREWAVFPCHSPAPNPGGCSCCRGCSSPAKHPRIRGGLNMATTDLDTIRAWWRRWPRANIGIRTGTPSGLVVVDIDPPHGGDESLDRLVRRHGPLPEGPTVRTGSGGRHFYFDHPGGEIRNQAGGRLGPGMDVRGDGGYIIAPPSRHASGNVYAWAGSGRDLAPAPPWLLDLMRTPEIRRPTAASSSLTLTARVDVGAWARSALDAELAAVRQAAEGTRNHTLNRAAFSLGQIAAGGHLDAGDVSRLLVESATVVGLTISEAEATVASGMEAGSSFPRHPSNRPAGFDGHRRIPETARGGSAVDLRFVQLDVTEHGADPAMFDLP